MKLVLSFIAVLSCLVSFSQANESSGRINVTSSNYVRESTSVIAQQVSSAGESESASMLETSTRIHATASSVIRSMAASVSPSSGAGSMTVSKVTSVVRSMASANRTVVGQNNSTMGVRKVMTSATASVSRDAKTTGVRAPVTATASRASMQSQVRTGPAPTKPASKGPKLAECEAKAFTKVIKGSADERAEKYTIGSFMKGSPKTKVAITELSASAQSGCGHVEVEVGGGWRQLDSVSAGAALVVPTSAKFRYRRTNTRCSSQCHGKVGFKFANVADSNADGSNAVVESSTKQCAVQLLLAPGPGLCPACTVKQNYNATIDEDSSRTCIKVSDYVDVDVNMTAMNAGDFAVPSQVKSKYEELLKDLQGAAGIRVTGAAGKLGQWSVTADITKASKPLQDLKVLNTSRYLCFRPGKNKNGKVELKYSCSVEIGEGPRKKASNSKQYTFTVNIRAVNDAPKLKRNSFPVPDLENNYVDGSNNGKRVGAIINANSESPEGITNLGLAIWKINSKVSKVNGIWQYKANGTGSWLDINGTTWTSHGKGKSGGQQFLLKADDTIRFKLRDTTKYWTKIEAFKYSSLLFRVWDMADGKASGIHNMTGATSLSDEIGQLIQLRKGCFGPGSKGGATDACGKCGGDNSTCAGCDGVPNSGAKFDRCRQCYGGTTNKTATVRDCFGGCGTAALDDCGICQRKPKGGKIQNGKKFKDCAGVCRNNKGTAKINKCGNCVGGNTTKALNYGEDKCGKCNGDNSTCRDCAGTPAGTKTKDLCKKCLEPGDASRDECSALGSGSKTCVVAGDTFDADVAMPKGQQFDSATCKFDNNNAATSKKGQKKLTLTVPDLAAGSYNVSCNLQGQSATLYSPSKVHIVKYSVVAVTGLNRTEQGLSGAPAKQNIAVTGTGFPNTGFVECVMTVNKRQKTLVGVYVSATSVICKGFPKQSKSVDATIALRFCAGTSTTTASNATFTWTTDLPAVTSARFTNCRTLNIDWNGPVEQKTGKTCNLAALFPTNAAALSTATCNWRRRSLQINLNSASLKSGDALTLDNAALNAFGAKKTNRVNATTAITTQAPANRKQPKVVLRPNSATTIGKCQNFRVSYNTRVRAGMTAVWTVSGSSDDSRWNNELKNKSFGILNITDKNTPINFTLKATNCFGDSTQESVLITKEDKEVPDIRLRNSEFTTSVNRKVVIRAPAKYGCAGVASSTLVYTWTFSPEFDTTNVIGLSAPKVTIPEGTLKANTTYTATITVSLLDDSEVSSSKSASITVESQALTGLVQGMQVVKDTGTGKFKARLRDPDDASDTPSYTWSISDSNGDGVVTKNFTAPTYADNAELSVDFSTLEVAAGTYTISCQMVKGQREVSASMNFELTTVEPPTVEITGIEGVVNWPQLIFVQAKITSKTAGSYAWQSDDYPTVTSLTGTSGNYRANKEQLANLVIDPTKVTEQLSAQEYTFNLVATQGGQDFTSTVKFTINLAPSPGTLSVDLTSGSALDTEFTATVGDNGCIDDDGVEYAFGYENLDSKIKFNYAPQTDNFITTTLGAGKLKFFVKCIDPNGAFVTAETAEITVSKPALTTAALDAKANEMSDLAKGGDIESIAKFGLALASSFSADDGVELTAAQQEAKQKMEAAIQDAILSLPPRTGDFEAGNQMIEVGGATVGGDTDAETKQKFAVAMGELNGLTKALIEAIFSGGSRRRRRSISGTSSALNVANVPENADVDSIKGSMNLQLQMVTLTDYTANALNERNVLFLQLDTFSISKCKTMVVGQARANIVGDSSVMSIGQLQMADETASSHTLGCATGTSGCIQSPAFTFKSTGVNKQVCLVGTTLNGDYHSQSEPSDTRLSNMIRVRTWNSTAEIKPNGDMNVTIYSNANTTNSYKCVVWDEANKVWTNTSLTTVNPKGTLDSASGTYHVTCRYAQLGDFMLIEGPAIEEEVVTTAAPGATTKAASTKEVATVKETTAASTEAATTAAAASTAAPSTAAPTDAATTAAAQPSTKGDTTKKSVLTVHPNDVDTVAKFVLHTGTCAEVFTDKTKSDATASAKKQVATHLSIPQASMENTNLTCVSDDVHMEWLQTPRDLTGNATVKSTIALLETKLGSGNFTITINNVTMISKKYESTPTQAPEKTPENYDHEVSFTLHTGNCSDVFTNDTERIAAEKEVQPQLATIMGVPESSLNGFKLKCGSVIAGWTQTDAGLTGNTTVVGALAKLKAQITSNTLNVKVGALTLTPDNTSWTQVAKPPPTQAATTNAATKPVTQAVVSAKESGLSGGAIAGIIVGVLLLVIIVVVVVVVYMKKIKPNRKTRSAKIKPADNDLELQEQQDENEKKPTGAKNPGYADSD